MGAHRRRLVVRRRGHTARPGSCARVVLDVRARRGRADAAARARRRPLLAPPERGPPLRDRRDAAAGRADVLPVGDPLGRAPDLRAGAAARGAGPILEQLALNDELASVLRARRFARGALQVQTPEAVFRFDGDGGVADAWLEGEPHAHMLVEELMILANESVGAFLASRNRAALYRVHEPPDPKAVEHLIAKLADLGVPTPPVPKPADTAARGDGRRRGVEARRDVRGAIGTRPGGVLVARPARAEAGALRPEEPRARGARERRLLPLHFADPPLSGSRRPPRAPPRARPRRRPAAGAICSTSPSTPPSASARRRRSSTPPTRSAWRGCSNAASTSSAGTSRGRGRSSG